MIFCLFSEVRLQTGLRRLVQAHTDDYSSVQYIQGLNCLALLELQRLYSALASMYYSQAHRHNLRIKYLMDSEWRSSVSQDITGRIAEEFWEYALMGTDPEDHYADDPADFLDEDDEFESEEGANEDDKLQVFLEWDHGSRCE